MALPRGERHAILAVMRPDQEVPGEVIQYRRSAALPGIELLDVYQSPRDWQLISPGYALCFLQTWRGNVRYHGQSAELTPGIAFCNYDDDPFVASPVRGEAGTFKALIMDPEVLRAWVEERQLQPVRAEWKTLFPRVSPRLSTRLQRLFQALEPVTPDLEAQSRAVELADALVAELITGATETVRATSRAARAALRMRECLEDDDLNVDLETLARAAGLDRFQALRAFKKRFGLPPHPYQMHLRIARARQLLLAGAAASEVAPRCGFSDQSHLIRHFKRIAGVTPKQYVRQHAISSGLLGR